jgi:hypothetical protein
MEKGVTILVSGDFRQTLPIIKLASPAQIIESTVKHSILWQYFKCYSLTQNMRTHGDEIEFAQWLLRVGSGEANISANSDDIVLPPDLLYSPSANIIDSVFDRTQLSNVKHVKSRCILAPLNSTVVQINENMLDILDPSVEATTYLSSDSVPEEHERDALVPVEYLNTLTPTGMPQTATQARFDCYFTSKSQHGFWVM